MTDQDDLPHNIAAEMAVLGAIIFDNNSFPMVAEKLGEGDFYAEANRRIWAAMTKLIQAGRTASAVSLKDWFERDDEFREIGGSRYMAELIDAAAFGPEIRDYADLIRLCGVRRRMMAAGQQLIDRAWRVPEVSTSYDAPTYLSAAHEILEEVATTVAPSTWETSLDAIARTLVEAQNPDSQNRLPTRIDKLDDLIGGLLPADLIVLAGRPSMGKSALCDQIEENVARQDPDDENPRTVAKFSLEMDRRQLSYRALSRTAHSASGAVIPYSRMRRGVLTPDDIETFRHTVDHIPNIYWDVTPNVDIAHMRTQLRRLKKLRGKIDLITCDYIQIMEMNPGRSENLAAAIGRTTKGLKALAKEFDCPVIALSQVSRAVEQREDKRPTLADLRESGAIEQDADVVLFCYREFYYLERAPVPTKKTDQDELEVQLAELEHVMDVICAKQRMGPIGTTRLYWEAQTSFISSRRSDVVGGRLTDDGAQQEALL